MLKLLEMEKQLLVIMEHLIQIIIHIRLNQKTQKKLR